VYRRGATEPWHRTIAAAGGLVVGAVAYYLATVWLARERIGPVRASPEEAGRVSANPEDQVSSSEVQDPVTR
jgi:uncharacterized membrane protein YeiB